MSVTGLEIVRLRREQFAAARQMLTRAFLDYPLMIYANEQLARRRRGVATLYGAIVRDSLRYGEVHVSAGVEGACCWLPPGVSLPSFAREVRSGMLGLPLGFGWAGFQRLVDFDHEQRRLHEKYAKGPHWFLATIGVDPAHQGRGIGSALMAPVLGTGRRRARAVLPRDPHDRQRAALRATRVSRDGAPREPDQRSALVHAAAAGRQLVTRRRQIVEVSQEPVCHGYSI